MLKSIAIAIMFLAASSGAAPACDQADNFAAQFKLTEILGHHVFTFEEGMSDRALGNEHWWLRVRGPTWADRIPNTCIRAEMRGYLRAEIYFVEKEARDRRKSADDLQLDAQTEARQKMENIEWPK